MNPLQPALRAVNDFVIKFANVNGSGSASANEMFARAVMRMGVPVSPRNIFPSNIQGLPTWYEVRVTEACHFGARGGVDFMVAMNPQTFDRDVAGIEPGGHEVLPLADEEPELLALATRLELPDELDPRVGRGRDHDGSARRNAASRGGAMVVPRQGRRERS